MRNNLINDLEAYTKYAVQVEEQTCQHCWSDKSKVKYAVTKPGGKNTIQVKSIYFVESTPLCMP